jgi:hypothetical protein
MVTMMTAMIAIAADGHDDDGDDRDRLLQRSNTLCHAGARTGRTCFLATRRDDLNGEQKQQREDDAGDHARQKQPSDRLFGEKAVDHQAGAWRKDKAHRAAGGDRTGRQRVVILEALHFRQRDAAHGDGRGRGRPAERGKERAGNDGRGS